MSRDVHPLIAREGRVPLLATLILAAVATWLWGIWSAPIWLLFAFVVQFFRDPRRVIPDEPGAVVSPADGKVVHVSLDRDPYLNREAWKVSVFMNVFSVHSNRAPVAGSVEQTWYHPGQFFNAALDKASLENERQAICLRTDAGSQVVSVQIAGLIARRILCYVDQGDALDRGQRYGFIRFGSRVDVYLPPHAEMRIQLGQWVSAGSDIIASLDQTGAPPNGNHG